MSHNTLLQLENHNEFRARHIGPDKSEVKSMLETLGFSDINELVQQAIPKNIRDQKPFEFANALGKKYSVGKTEAEFLGELRTTMSENQVFESLIGIGFHDTLTPSIIQRNILENPAWYTAYTPYQAEISQGRLEALLNFQTMIKDLTGMDLSNSSLLDEGTAAAEAMAMALAISKRKDSPAIFVSKGIHPHSLEVLQTRCEPLGVQIHVGDPAQFDFSKNVFACFVQYPNSEGSIVDYSEFTKKAHEHGALLVAAVDLLSLTLLTPPGEWGADIVIGNSQRFGVPLGFGGPHAAFMATKESHKRLMPGRIIGVSVDDAGKPALRLALQTREQHIRREKATSNICTAQVLLANMASMYACYHGPTGLKRIAERVQRLTLILAEGLRKLGYSVPTSPVFDTITFDVGADKFKKIQDLCTQEKINLRLLPPSQFGISLNETSTRKTVEKLWKIFSMGASVNFSIDTLDTQVKSNLPEKLVRKSEYLTHPVFNTHHSETELLRYIHLLQQRDISLAYSMIPLGSCTMKLNATSELMPLSWPEVGRIHPFAPMSQAQGYLKMIHLLERRLCEITGFAAVSLQPNAGSQGEYAGLLAIRKYHQSRGQGARKICLIPSSAHGTNPASAVMAGMEVVVVNCDELGNVDVADLKKKAQEHKNDLAALMITYPSTHGVFEASITDVCKIIHDNGGQVYMDGANMNALVGLCRPGEFGPDVSHMNLHKTFAIPHGGGGPGVGPIGVAAHLKNFLPRHSMVPEAGPATGVSSTTSAPWGSASILTISLGYIEMMGAEGLQEATQVAILNANYIAKKLTPHYPVLYKGTEGLVAHECIIDVRQFKKTANIDVTDIAKRLIDYGFHAPTMSFPVAGTLMIEPTESEAKGELDRFVDAMIAIREEIRAIEDKKMHEENNPLRRSPHTMEAVMSDAWDRPYSREQAAFPLAWIHGRKYWPAVGRVDNAYGDRNLVCACPAIDEYR
ncbi:MAG: aminomethyl-transferring glycine dehydrogenase [Pseudobdellovibrionaceae bacterium]